MLTLFLTFKCFLDPFYKVSTGCQFLQTKSAWLSDVHQNFFRLHQVIVYAIELLSFKVSMTLIEEKAKVISVCVLCLCH